MAAQMVAQAATALVGLALIVAVLAAFMEE